MNTTKMTIAELPEAVEAFISSGCDADQMRTLMDLLQVQTEYYQNRFWKMVGNQSQQPQRKGHTMSIYLEDLAQDELETIAEAYDLNVTWGQDFAILNH